MIIAQIIILRKLLQSSDPDPFDIIVPNDSTFNATTTKGHLATPTTPFDASIALTIIILLTVLFFMGFFSAYIRRFSENNENLTTTTTRQQNRKGGGLEPSVINSLPLVPYGKATKHPMIDDCAICLSEFGERESVKVIPYCGHVFHPCCVDTWLASHVTCPICRSAQLFERCELEVCLNVARDKDVGEGSNGGDADTSTGDDDRL